ncbi:MAG: hypothetical protein JWM02_3359 [Frankiales bacterium]|nr:hypothetical protein [Frankiales bacterium]
MPALPHFLTRKSVVVPVALVLFAVVAFEGYASYTRSKPVDYSRGGEQFASPASSTSPAGAGSSPTARPTVRATPAAGGSSSSLPRADASPTLSVTPTFTQGTTQGATATATATVAGVVLAVPRTGTY